MQVWPPLRSHVLPIPVRLRILPVETAVRLGRAHLAARQRHRLKYALEAEGWLLIGLEAPGWLGIGAHNFFFAEWLPAQATIRFF